MVIHNGYVHIHIRDNLINAVKAQEELDRLVLNDSQPYVPYNVGNLRNSGIYGTVPGSGEVTWLSIYAHYMYEGKAMVGVESRSAYAKKYEPKEYNGETLNYHTAGTGSHWFEKAKQNKLESWIAAVKNVLLKK